MNFKNILKKSYYTISKFIPLLTSIQRLYISLFYKKEKFVYASDKDVFITIHNNNYWSDDQSSSGGGSSAEATKRIREFLPSVFEKYKIKTMLDIPCGDFEWMRLVDKKNISYIGADIVPNIIKDNNDKYAQENINFKIIDLTKDKLPQVDLIFCKDCLQHLSYDSVYKALKNIINSKSKYLLVTSYPRTWKNWDILDGDYRPLNLAINPYNIKGFIEKCLEKANKNPNDVEIDKTMYLFDISKIQLK